VSLLSKKTARAYHTAKWRAQCDQATELDGPLEASIAKLGSRRDPGATANTINIPRSLRERGIPIVASFNPAWIFAASQRYAVVSDKDSRERPLLPLPDFKVSVIKIFINLVIHRCYDAYRSSRVH